MAELTFDLSSIPEKTHFQAGDQEVLNNLDKSLNKAILKGEKLVEINIDQLPSQEVRNKLSIAYESKGFHLLFSENCIVCEKQLFQCMCDDRLLATIPMQKTFSSIFIYAT